MNPHDNNLPSEKALSVNTDPNVEKAFSDSELPARGYKYVGTTTERTRMEAPPVTIRRRQMSHQQWLRLRRAARKMVQDVRKYIKRRRL